MKKRINQITPNTVETPIEEDNKQIVYGWCVMASEQNADKNRIIIYTDRQKPRRGNNGWEGDGNMFYGPTKDKRLTEGRTCHSEPILIKMTVEIV